MEAANYITSLGLEIRPPSRSAIGRLALAGEFELDGALGVLLRPKRGEISERYLELLAAEGYQLAALETGAYPTFYESEGKCLAPARALPVRQPTGFPGPEVLDAWAGLIARSANGGDAGRIGVRQLVAWLEGGAPWGPELVRPTADVPVVRLGGDETVDPEPLRTAAALLAGYRARPSSTEEALRLARVCATLLSVERQDSGLERAVGPFVQLKQLGSRRLLATATFGAELAALAEAAGTVVLPAGYRTLEPLLERLLPGLEWNFADFLDLQFESHFDGVVIVPPLGRHVSGARLKGFHSPSFQGGGRRRVSTETLYLERGLAATAEGGVLLAVLPEGLLSSAGQAAFRNWLLTKARVLAVLSFPSGSCLCNTSVKCSLLLLHKVTTNEDYPILMVDVEASDVASGLDSVDARLRGFLDREAATCAP